MKCTTYVLLSVLETEIEIPILNRKFPDLMAIEITLYYFDPSLPAHIKPRFSHTSAHRATHQTADHAQSKTITRYGTNYLKNHRNIFGSTVLVLIADVTV